jgi:predicted heme/steroid binding protein
VIRLCYVEAFSCFCKVCSATMASDAAKKLPTLSLAQVQARKADGWIAIDGEVYDMSPFLDEHPGGRDLILDNAGGDATHIFKSDEMHNHSDKAWEMLSRYALDFNFGAHGVPRYHVGHFAGWHGERYSISSRPPAGYKIPVDLTKAAVPQVCF